jgi:hypothetical protein
MARPPEVGARYRVVRLDGSLAPVVWEVAELFTSDVDGGSYARLRQVGDRTRVKSVGVAVLSDRRHFLPVDGG